MNRRTAIFACVTVSTLWPPWARADAGTPLVWGSAFHLLLGNALIGVFEGWLLAQVFHLPKGRCIRLLILANYLSAWIGLALAKHWFHEYAADIYSGLRVTWILVGV